MMDESWLKKIGEVWKCQISIDYLQSETNIIIIDSSTNSYNAVGSPDAALWGAAIIVRAAYFGR